MERINEAIVLAGGLGTRLRGMISDVPKCLVPVGDQTFIDFVIKELLANDIDRIVFSLGYMGDLIENHLSNKYPDENFVYVHEEEPLGTGGAIKFAAAHLEGNHFFVLNGDTLFTANFKLIAEAHLKTNAICTLALKPMKKFDRYGAVVISEKNRIISFHEKTYCEEGIINGGIYLIDLSKFNSLNFPTKFSFEKAFLEAYVEDEFIGGIICDNYFIDIGIPEDYKKAISDLT